MLFVITETKEFIPSNSIYIKSKKRGVQHGKRIQWAGTRERNNITREEKENFWHGRDLLESVDDTAICIYQNHLCSEHNTCPFCYTKIKIFT